MRTGFTCIWIMMYERRSRGYFALDDSFAPFTPKNATRFMMPASKAYSNCKPI
jgi:hypothetical protein